jgi:hypothetical protein
LKKSIEIEEPYVLSGWGLHEKDITENLKHYFEHMDPKLKQSFSSLDVLQDQLMSGYDPHLLVYKQPSSQTMSGLIAFNLDTMV